MTQSQTFRNGITINIDENDKSEYGKVGDLDHINPSLEFYLVDNASDFTDACIVGAGCGVATGILESAGVSTTNIEPNADRFAILDQNFSDETNIEKACSDTNGTGTMYFFDDNKSGGILDMIFGDSTQETDIITIDSLLLANCDLLVISANGKEVDVLKGAETLIGDNSGIKVVIEWKPDQISSINTAIQYLRDNFTSIKIIHWETGDTISFNTVDVDENEENLRAVMTATLLLEWKVSDGEKVQQIFRN